jgi:hypothetical protein
MSSIQSSNGNRNIKHNSRSKKTSKPRKTSRKSKKSNFSNFGDLLNDMPDNTQPEYASMQMPQNQMMQPMQQPMMQPMMQPMDSMPMDSMQSPFLNSLQNPNNLDFDPLHVNYITPKYENLNINNYGINYDKLSQGPQTNGLSSYKNPTSIQSQIPQMPQMQMPQMQMPQMQMPQMQMPQMQMPQMQMNQMQIPQNNDRIQMGGSRKIRKN